MRKGRFDLVDLREQLTQMSKLGGLGGVALTAGVSWIPLPTDRHDEVFGELLALPGIRADHVPDAHLAALAIEHGLTLCSASSGFARFSRLRWTNPLVS